MYPTSYLGLRRRLIGQTSGSARRRARERRQAELTRAEGERLARDRREQRRLDKIEHERQAREELASYQPWGRAGGGAPNPGGVRYTNLRVGEIYPEDELKGTVQYEACRQWNSPLRRQRRAPLRLREDPQICYSDALQKSVNNDIRYKKTPDEQKNYKEILDDLVDKRNKALKAQKKRDLDYERKMGWTNNEIFNNLKGDHNRHKRMSLTLPKVKREDDSHDKENKPSSVEKLPDINKSSSEEYNEAERTKSNNKEKSIKVKEKEVQKQVETKTKQNPRKKKYVKRLANAERIKRVTISDEEVPNQIVDNVENREDEKKPTPEKTILRLTGGIELVPLLARRRRVEANTLHSSDVTRPPDRSCEWREILNMNYLKELKNQIRIKYELKEESRKDSAESVKKHHETWASLWGRPGHGAPQRGRYARSNLAQLLYVSPLAQPA